MTRKIIFIIPMLLLVAIQAGADVWPVNAGQICEYTAYPLDSGEPWIEQFEVSEQVTHDSKKYFPFGDSHFRSTKDKIYEWEPGGETLFFQITPVGTTWEHSTDNTVVILDDNFLVEGVYGGPYRAYKLEFSDPWGIWNMYVVPNVGLVQLDEFDEEPPKNEPVADAAGRPGVLGGAGIRPRSTKYPTRYDHHRHRL